ncbi:hypothetical protein GALL_397970 [mine drainage metagenome]|uniref:Uncharacterized protein n=1 Tax=mine drainage metagenome TaxID=410659 RepID=A0A1J5Q5I9_9ZZZZ
MRIYLPATVDELDPVHGHRPPLAPRVVHAVTPALRDALHDEDEEGCEFAAHLAAADDSLLRIAGRPEAPHQRLVVTAVVPESFVEHSDSDAAPSALRLISTVPWDRVVCVHVDEPEAMGDVAAALRGDEDAAGRLSEADLLWYDVSEVDDLPR